MPEPSILIVHPDRKTQRAVQRILGATGFQVEIADDLDQGIRLIALRASILVVVDGNLALAPRAGEFFAAARARGTEACMTLLGGMSSEQLPAILGLGAVTNLLVHPMPILAEELTITAQKLMRNDLFGAEKYVLWGTTLRAVTLTRSRERADVVAQVAEQVRAIGQSPRVASMAMLLTDELLSNAVHNAPVDAAGTHYRADEPRDLDFELDERHRVELRWGCDVAASPRSRSPIHSAASIATSSCARSPRTTCAKAAAARAWASR